MGKTCYLGLYQPRFLVSTVPVDSNRFHILRTFEKGRSNWLAAEARVAIFNTFSDSFPKI